MREHRDRFIAAAFWHGSIAASDAVLAAHPEIAHDFHVAAMLGDDATVRRLLAEDRSRATARSGPREVDALTHLCFSCYLTDGQEIVFDLWREGKTIRYKTREPLPDANAAAWVGLPG